MEGKKILKKKKLFFSSFIGTSDEHISIVEHLKDIEPDGAVLVTTPQVINLSINVYCIKRKAYK